MKWNPAETKIRGKHINISRIVAPNAKSVSIILRVRVKNRVQARAKARARIKVKGSIPKGR